MRWSILPCLFAVACTEPLEQLNPDTGPSRDAATDAGVDSGTIPDADVDGGVADTGFDAGQRDAAKVDGALTGTSLEDVRLEWTQPVVLCDEFREGTSLEDAVAHKTMVELSPQPRSTLEPGDLGTISLENATVDHGPLAADQWSGSAVGSTLTRWETFGPADATQLSAEVAHDLGARGTLFESFYVTRSAGDTRPVIYGQDEVAFYLEPPNGDSIQLSPCGGPSDLEPAVFVLSATDGAETLTVIREQNMRYTRAGTFPVFPVRSEVQLSKYGAWGLLASGHWSQVYTAEHHNWDEQSQIRFDHDLPHYFSTFGPYDRGDLTMGQMVRTIELVGVNTPWNNSTATVIEQSFSDGAEISTTYSVDVDWTRIDGMQLERESACATPNVETLWGVGSTNYQLQVVRCGSIIETIVPVYFPPDVTQVGTRLAATQNGVVATAVAGSHTIRIDESGFSAQLIVLDAGGTEIENTSAYGITLFEVNGSAYRMTATRSEADVSAEITRQAVAQGVGNSTIYAPVSFSLSFDGQTHSVRAWDAMTYSNSHHNWDDTLEAETDELRISWAVLEFGQSWRVSAVRKSDGTQVLPSTVIR